MTKLIRQLLVILMMGVVSAGAFAQKKDKDDKRPPKEPAKVITKDRKDNRPPPKNTNQPKPDNRKKPFFE